MAMCKQLLLFLTRLNECISSRPNNYNTNFYCTHPVNGSVTQPVVRTVHLRIRRRLRLLEN